MPVLRRPARHTPVLLITVGLLLTGCAAPAQRIEFGPDDTLKAAQRLVTDRCLIRQGLTPPRPGGASPSPDRASRISDALFGTGRAELSLTLPGGHVISQHTDGCLAAAQRRLYGDQRRWFRVSTSMANLRSAAPLADRTEYRLLREDALQRARTLLTEAAYAQKGNRS
ncbi:hypothetical protein ACFWFI_21875 [Streptomyces sp. NPDC060209]|uniref:hypothetical protein n=1 Tax=Streptomyces sp. NPDC060209 TaxID=3347073 RepID=UPI00365906C1